MVKTIVARAIRYHKFGDPRKVLQMDRIRVRIDLKADEVLVRWLASPINPLDINLIEGVYAIRNSLPSIGGSEGVGEVERIGPNVTALKVGDRVISLVSNTWAEFGIVQEDNLIGISKKVDLISAAQFLINPPTAYCMLKFFREDLKPGDYVIQNAANSGVGRAVIQLARAFGLKSINMVRDRPNIEALKQELKAIGADYVLTEEEFAKGEEGRRLVAENEIKLACNGVGGRSALTISASLAHGGTCVTYGGMSRQPHQFSTGALVFKNLKVVGYAHGLWMRDPRNQEDRNRMFEELQDLIITGRLKPTPVQAHNFPDFSRAIETHMDGRHGKQLLFIDETASRDSVVRTGRRDVLGRL